MEFVQPIRDRIKIENMKKILKKRNLRDYCLVVLGINSGLRVSDLLKLTISDVLDEGGKVKDRITLREKKTGKTKSFPLSDNAKKAVQEYLMNREYQLQEPLFISRKGSQGIQRAQAWKIINDVARSVGIIENIGTHTLRKTFAYHAYKNGTDIILLQKILNHHSSAITLRYIGITQEEMDDVYLTVNL